MVELKPAVVYQRLVSICRDVLFFLGVASRLFIYYGNDGMGPNEVGEQAMLMVTALNVAIHKDMIYKGFVVPATDGKYHRIQKRHRIMEFNISSMYLVCVYALILKEHLS